MSPTSVCYAVSKAGSGGETVWGAKTRGSLGKKAGSGGSSAFQTGIRHRTEKVSDLRVSKDSHRIRKQPLPLPQVQYRPPIIIHTYSPKVIYTQPDDFMSLVQKLTGSSDTRLRLKRKPANIISPAAATAAAAAAPASGRSVAQNDVADAASAELEQQESKTAQCASPTSSEDDSSFLASDAGESSLGMKQLHSPRSPLTNFDVDNHDLLFTAFDGAASSGLFSHVKAEPSLNVSSFNFFTESFNSKPESTKPQLQAMHQLAEYNSPFHSNIDINAPLPPLGPFLPSMAGLSDLPPSANWSQSLLDCLTGAPGSFTNQSQILRQRFSGGYSPSSEGTMVALENIQAFMLS